MGEGLGPGRSHVVAVPLYPDCRRGVYGAIGSRVDRLDFSTAFAIIGVMWTCASPLILREAWNVVIMDRAPSGTSDYPRHQRLMVLGLLSAASLGVALLATVAHFTRG